MILAEFVYTFVETPAWLEITMLAVIGALILWVVFKKPRKGPPEHPR